MNIFLLLILIAPTYAIRFSIFGINLNLLMLALPCVWLYMATVEVRTHSLTHFFRKIYGEIRLHQFLYGAIALFVLAGTISTVVGGMSVAKLGQLLVLFYEPVVTFVLLRVCVQHEAINKSKFVWTLAVFTALLGVLAIVQYHTLWLLPREFWGNTVEPRRATGVWSHANFYALFVAPLLALLATYLPEKLRAVFFKPRTAQSYIWPACYAVSVIGLGYSLSRAAWLGLGVALVVLVFLQLRLKYSVALLGVGVILAGSVLVISPTVQHRVIAPFSGETSASARVSLWRTSLRMIKDDPILGKGLTGFSQNFDRYNTDARLEKYPAPHNIFLNFWVETGLLGLFSFCAIVLYIFKLAWRRESGTQALGIGLFLICLVMQGLVDIPYLKNDLALVFWVIAALAFPRKSS